MASCFQKCSPDVPVEFVGLWESRVAMRARVLSFLVVFVHLVLLQIELGGEVSAANATRKVPDVRVGVVHVRSEPCESRVDPALGANVALFLCLNRRSAHEGAGTTCFLLFLGRLVILVVFIVLRQEV